MNIDKISKIEIETVDNDGKRLGFLFSDFKDIEDSSISFNQELSNSLNKFVIDIRVECSEFNSECIKENIGKSLIGKEIKKGTRVKIINVEPHRNAKNYKCLDEYIGKIGHFWNTITFNETDFMCSLNFEKEYMNLVDKENSYLNWRWDEVEILED